MPITIIKSSDSEFKPHMAVCHMEFNSGSANEENIPLVMKSKKIGDDITAILKSLGEGDDVIQKASYRNIQRMLESAIREAFRPEEDENRYYYVYLNDFDGDTAVFEYSDNLYSVSYSLNDRGVVLLGGDIQEVVRQEVYISKDGSDLLLKSVDVKDPAVDTEGQTEGEESSDISQEEENKMTDKVELSAEELEARIQKGAADLILKARQEWEAEATAATILKSTTELVKQYSFVEESDCDAVVKSLVNLGEDMLVVIKALDAAKKAIEVVEAEKEEIKKEFSTQQSAPGQPDLSGLTPQAMLAANLKKAKNAQSK